MGRATSGFLRSVSLRADAPGDGYPYDLAAVAALHADPIVFGDVTVLVGQNGSGKSTLIEAIAVAAGLHAQSHGESFLRLIESRFGDAGFYVMDEPESALSFQGQLGLLRFMHDAVAAGSQFVIATHSPVLMRMPGAIIYDLDAGIAARDYDDLTVVELWRRFMNAPERILDTLFADDPTDGADT
jgi:predicted ATPase